MRPESSMDSTVGKEEGINVKKCSLSKQKAGFGQSRDGLESDGDVVIDVDCDGGVDGVGDTSGAGKEEKMCRVCHLSSDCFAQTGDLIQLGCRCRNDLGTAHRSCAELWFATKGNRFCEICGAVARNISGVGDNSLMLEWNDAPRTSQPYMSAERRYQPVCTFVAAIIFMALAIHWLVRENPHRDPS